MQITKHGNQLIKCIGCWDYSVERERLWGATVGDHTLISTWDISPPARLGFWYSSFSLSVGSGLNFLTEWQLQRSQTSNILAQGSKNKSFKCQREEADTLLRLSLEIGIAGSFLAAIF